MFVVETMCYDEGNVFQKSISEERYSSVEEGYDFACDKACETIRHLLKNKEPHSIPHYELTADQHDSWLRLEYWTEDLITKKQTPKEVKADYFVISDYAIANSFAKGIHDLFQELIDHEIIDESDE